MNGSDLFSCFLLGYFLGLYCTISVNAAVYAAPIKFIGALSNYS